MAQDIPSFIAHVDRVAEPEGEAHVARARPHEFSAP
jgi:hypothetical protein